MDDETREIVECFVLECREALDEVEPLFVGLERVGGTPPAEALERAFRLFHSVKGTAGYLQGKTIERVTHRAETVIELLQKGALQGSPSVVELLCRVLDLLRARLGILLETGADGDEDDSTRELMRELEACASGEPMPVPAPVSTLDLVEPFIIDAREQLDICEAALLAVEDHRGQPSENSDAALRALHSFKGNAGFLGFGEMESLAHSAESLLDEIRHMNVPFNSASVSMLLQVVDALRGSVARLPSDSSVPLGPQLSGALGAILLEGQALNQRTLLGKVLLEQQIVEPATVATALQDPNHRLGQALQNLGKVTPEQLDSALAMQAHQRGVEPRTDTAAPQRKPQPSLRVDVAKLDLLMDLVGELIIAETAVMATPGSTDAANEHRSTALAQLDRVTRSLQDVAMSLRMVPIEATFRKMIRLARDVSAKQGKQVSLRLVGEETEVDKTVAEVIADPLVHLLRNSVDHGIESPAERIAMGKPAEGVVELSARHVGGEVWIEVRDDGRGVSREKVLAKAVSRGLVDASVAETLTDSQVFAFIFEAGFSTAAEVTDISGRGVGMDVVKRQLESVKGRVEVASIPGKGTALTLRIPLTLAIIEGMLVRVGEQSFTIPLLHIRESVVPRAKDLTRLADGLEMVRIRGQLMPVLRLHRFFDVEPQHADLEKGILVVVEDGGTALCLLVDELVGQRQTVIKGLSGYLGELAGLSGCTVMGDGRISLIIDVASLLNAAGRTT